MYAEHVIDTEAKRLSVDAGLAEACVARSDWETSMRVCLSTILSSNSEVIESVSESEAMREGG